MGTTDAGDSAQGGRAFSAQVMRPSARRWRGCRGWREGNWRPLSVSTGTGTPLLGDAKEASLSETAGEIDGGGNWSSCLVEGRQKAYTGERTGVALSERTATVRLWRDPGKRHLEALYAKLGVRGAIAFIRQSCARPG